MPEDITLRIASAEDAAAAVDKLLKIDREHIYQCALEMPDQVLLALDAGMRFELGEIPLDHSRLHLIGLGGSAIAGELILDMLAPRRVISLHRGTLLMRDRCGVVLSSYSGNTSEVIELAEDVIGGAKTLAILTSGGKLAELGREWGVPVWKIPQGYQPRAAVGWSLGLLACLVERWGISPNLCSNLRPAAKGLSQSLNRGKWPEHPLVRAALPIAEALTGRVGLIFHTLRCSSCAHRLATQLNENAKQPAFTLAVPEAMHNTVEGLADSDPERWTLVFMSDAEDRSSLRDAMKRMMKFFSAKGFRCIGLPAAGKDPFETTLSRLLLVDFVSLFTAALRDVNPTPIKAITALKSSATN